MAALLFAGPVLLVFTFPWVLGAIAFVLVQHGLTYLLHLQMLENIERVLKATKASPCVHTQSPSRSLT